VIIDYAYLRVLGLLAMVGIIVLASAPLARSQTTLSELQLAFQRETNDNARYLTYARQADVEGLAEVAALFRAIARAEAIHAGNHAQIIRTMGATASALPEAVKCGATEENLQAAIANEERQQHRTYPALVHRAKREYRSRIAERIQRLREAEGQHGILFSQALTTLRLSNPSSQRYYYVCPECGYTTEEITFDKCPVCFAAEERFEMIS
jgi:rubrerythrin